MSKEHLHDYFEEARASQGIAEEELMNLLQGAPPPGLSPLNNPLSNPVHLNGVSTSMFAGMSGGMLIASVVGMLVLGAGIYLATTSGHRIEPAGPPPAEEQSGSLSSRLPSLLSPGIEAPKIGTQTPSMSRSENTVGSLKKMEAAVPPQKDGVQEVQEKEVVPRRLPTGRLSERYKISEEADSPIDYSLFTIENISGLNTVDLEYAPFITTDGSMLYFVSNRPGGMGGHDIWYARRTDPGSMDFDPPVNVGPPINSDLNEGMMSMTADGKELFFTLCNRPDGVGDCDIYTARNEEGEWKDIRNLRSVNSVAWDSQPSVSTHGDTLYFTSNRSGTLGGEGDADIFMAVRDAGGQWSLPVNLGGPINTSEREDSPFIVQGKGRLYFSSMGHGGYGKLDFFAAERDADGTWSQPQNLGEPFNTEMDERMLTTTPDERTFYFTSERNAPSNMGTLDLFRARQEKPGLITDVTDEVYLAPPRLTLYPNPATDYISFRLEGTRTTTVEREPLLIIDQNGKEVLRLEDAREGNPISVSDLPSGTYFVRIAGAKSSFILRK